MTDITLDLLNEQLRQFAIDRDWEQFQSPKNLSMALIGEAAELVEHFQWLTEEQSYQLPPEKHQAAALEMADILIYLLRISDRMGVNLLDAVEKKIEINQGRYPVEKVKGSAKKYNEY
ncbi:MAG TPA: nucleotide pyrophosphohydrolase [Gammaproteobacteria bacterium]|nr:nucleotide pyrophosphohydrolase [Gammaproteobacteria bacterium]